MIRFRVDKERLIQLWRTEMSNAAIAAELGITELQLYVAGRHYKLEPRYPYVRRVSAKYDPTPETIAERAAEIRAGWSDEEREKRRVGNVVNPKWEMPTFAYDGRNAVFSHHLADR